MKRYRRACVVVTIFSFLLTSATSVAADCAWVLWRSETELTVWGKMKGGVFLPHEGRLFLNAGGRSTRSSTSTPTAPLRSAQE